MYVNGDAFEAFFEAVHGYRPFPWQARLAREVVQGGSWPEVLALPTGAGKTAVIDVAVFAMSAMARGGGPRVPRRVFFVIDRRVVVDEAYRRAAHLAQRLRDALSWPGGVLHDIAVGMQALGGDVPLEVAIMRGGLYLDHEWVRSPAQPLVCVSTVDQAGSRLLWRGYGVGADRPNNMLPVHAALLGGDALILLDEAHMSSAFGETLAWIRRYRTWAERPLGDPWQVVLMSATPPHHLTSVYTETDDDRTHPVLGRRLKASKLARLVEVSVASESGDASGASARTLEQQKRRVFAQRLATEAISQVEEWGARVVGLVVNRVATAREVFRLLRELRPSVDAVLLTGRVRPMDRDRLLHDWLPRAKAGRRRDPSDRPLFVVATQSIEVGADLDCDALVTECAALDALRQRFGRLDRMGEMGQTRAVIAIRSDQTERGYDDPVYGEALSRTWAWLESVAERPRGKRAATGSDPVMNMGIEALRPLLPQGEELDALCTPRRSAPVVLPGHLDLWVQTSPRPRPDPDIAVFLHGPDPAPPEVQVVWRSDLDVDHPETWADTVAMLPPLSIETMPVPFTAVRSWLSQGPVQDMADVEGARFRETSGGMGREHVALRWEGPAHEATGLVRPEAVRPGDTLVVPALYGGADEFGWDPLSVMPVPDLSPEAYRVGRRQLILRLHPRLIAELLEPEHTRPEAVLQWIADLSEETQSGDGAAGETEERLLAHLAGDELARPDVRQRASILLRQRRTRRLYPDGKGVLLVGRAEVQRAEPRVDGHLTDEDDAAMFTRRVGLEAHQRDAERMVRRFAMACSLPNDLVGDLALAALVHDLGKLDPRFQVLLHGGDELAAVVSPEPIAKSDMDPHNRSARLRAIRAARLPQGYRHEATSSAVVSAHAWLLREATDPELVLHLIESHHGCGRPFMPAIRDDEAGRSRIEHGALEACPPPDGLAGLEAGTAERFWALVRRYGWYGLAYLEAVLRLADHRASETERGAGDE